jgi:hypothetical protein
MNHLKDRPLPAGEVLSPARVLRGFALSESVADLVGPRLQELVRSIPRLRTWRGFNEGAWVLGARTAADNRRTTRADYSRVEFEIRVRADQELVDLTCRRTHRGRDLRAAHLSIAPDAVGHAALGRWVEGLLLSFAERYFERTA